MKFEFPVLVYVFKTVIIALLLAILGFVLFPYLGLENLPVRYVFSTAVLAGAIIGSLVSSVNINLPREIRTESIFIGNLPFKMTSNAVRKLFEQYGKVHTIRLMTDRVTRKPRGFGFIEMNRRDAMAAIRALNGTELHGRQIKVNLANERKPSQNRQAA